MFLITVENVGFRGSKPEPSEFPARSRDAAPASAPKVDETVDMPPAEKAKQPAFAAERKPQDDKVCCAPRRIPVAWLAARWHRRLMQAAVRSRLCSLRQVLTRGSGLRPRQQLCCMQRQPL